MVMFAPGGVASLIMMNMHMARFGKLKRLWTNYVALIVSGTVAVLGVAALVEMIYHIQLNSARGPMVEFAGLHLNTSSALNWISAATVMLVGLGLLEFARRRFAAKWGTAQEEIELELKRLENAP